MRGITQILTIMRVVRSRLRNREISTREQVEDAESMINEEGVPAPRVSEEL